MKTCPYCAEEIQDKAIKCRWCGEFLEEVKKEMIVKKQETTKSEENNTYLPQQQITVPINQVSSVETVKVNIDGKLVEVPRWYKDLSKEQKDAVNKKLKGIKLRFIIVFSIILGILDFISQVTIDSFSPISGSDSSFYSFLFRLIISTVLVIFIVVKFLSPMFYNRNRSKGNLHKVAYLATIKGAADMRLKKEELIENNPIENNNTTTEKARVIDGYSLTNGSDEMNIVEKEVLNTYDDKNEENNFPIWLIPVIIFLLYFLFQALKEFIIRI